MTDLPGVWKNRPQLPHSACSDSAQSFAIIRGGHIDVSVLDAIEVSENGSPKFMPQCTLRLTGTDVAEMVITDLCVFRRPRSLFKLIELAPRGGGRRCRRGDDGQV